MQIITEAFNQFDQLPEVFGEEEAIGMVAGMAGFKTKAATRKKLVEAGLLEARKLGLGAVATRIQAVFYQLIPRRQVWSTWTRA